MLVPERDLDVGRYIPLITLVCPEEVFPYSIHILKLFISSKNYSTLYDLATLAVGSFETPVTLPMNVLHELEAYHLASAVGSFSPSLTMAMSVVHIGREVTEFAGGLRDLNIGTPEWYTMKRLMNKLRNTGLEFAKSVSSIPLFNMLTNTPANDN